MLLFIKKSCIVLLKQKLRAAKRDIFMFLPFDSNFVHRIAKIGTKWDIFQKAGRFSAVQILRDKSQKPGRVLRKAGRMAALLFLKNCKN